MSRLPPLPRDQLMPEKQPFHDRFTLLAQKAFGPSASAPSPNEPEGQAGLMIWAERNGALKGLYPFLLATGGAGAALRTSPLIARNLPTRCARDSSPVVTSHSRGEHPMYAHYAMTTKADLLAAAQANLEMVSGTQILRLPFDVSGTFHVVHSVRACAQATQRRKQD
ncbi:hypothetical protein LTR12_018122 [Friedmanniomyces endolithicus]|nr:hypothetical protein LTR12_018122 [Friedmanniomyces endolithicus]